MAKPITTQQGLLFEINERLQCPVCFELPKNNIYQCRNCSYSICHTCYRQIVPRQLVVDGLPILVKYCPQNCPGPFYEDKPIRNLLWKQLAELFRKNANLVNPVRTPWNIQYAIKYLWENISITHLAGLAPFLLIYLVTVDIIMPTLKTDIKSGPSLKTWNPYSVQDKTKEYFRIAKDQWRQNKADSEQIAFLNLIFKETPTWPERDLEWLRNGTLFLAAQYGSLESFFYILEKPNIHPNVIDEDGIAPLHLTLIDEDEKRGERKAKILQLFGADVANFSEASTALHAAAKWGSTNKMKTLLERNADPNAKDAFGLTPLFLAMKNENEKIALEIIEELLRHEANCSVTNKNGTADALDIARQHRTIKFLRSVENLFEKYQPDCLEANFRRHEKLLNQLKQLGLREELSVFYYGERKDETKVTPKPEVELSQNVNSGVCLAPWKTS